MLAPIDVEVRVVFDALERATADPESVGERRVEFPPVVVGGPRHAAERPVRGPS